MVQVRQTDRTSKSPCRSMVKAETVPETSQDKILYQIKRRGPQTVRELGLALDVTTMGVRQHLSRLEEEGLVSATPEESGGRGRPVRRWKLTGAGHKRFPDAHAQVTSDLIISVRQLLGEEAINKVIDQRTRDTLANYTSALAKHASLKKRLQTLCTLRSKEGYMAELEIVNSNTYRLLEHHCPICVAAQSCQGFCRSELDVFKQLFEGVATVEREDHLLQGARRCSYLIQRRGPAT